jgi:hypothetical protein
MINTKRIDLYKSALSVIVSLVVLLILCTGCKPPISKEKEEQKVKQTEIKSQVVAMATLHSADYEWLRVAGKFEFLSIELQKALLQPEGKKCFLIGSLKDLIEKDGRYKLTIKNWSHDILYHLQCSSEQAESIFELSGKTELLMGEEYALIFQPLNLKRPFAVLEDNGNENLILEDVILVEGKCIDFMHLENTSLDIEDFLNN